MVIFIFRSLLLSLLLLHLIIHSQQQIMEMSGPTAAPGPSPEGIDCEGACSERCKEIKRGNLCGRACGSCCIKCKCVPPGTSGNYEACPCYFNLVTRNQIRKCP